MLDTLRNEFAATGTQIFGNFQLTVALYGILIVGLMVALVVRYLMNRTVKKENNKRMELTKMVGRIANRQDPAIEQMEN